MNKSSRNPPSGVFAAFCEVVVSRRAIWLDLGLLVPNQASLEWVIDLSLHGVTSLPGNLGPFRSSPLVVVGQVYDLSLCAAGAASIP